MASGKTSHSLRHNTSNKTGGQLIRLDQDDTTTKKPSKQALVPITQCAVHSHPNNHSHDTPSRQLAKPVPKPKPKVLAYEDEEGDSDEERGSSSGLREIATRKTVNSHQIEGPMPHIPLRSADVALKQTLQIATSKNGDALAYIDDKVERAKSQGLFSTEFTFGEIEGLGAASHKEYVGFIQLLHIMGYNAKYVNNDKKDNTKEIFQPSTVIYLEWIPKK